MKNRNLSAEVHAHIKHSKRDMIIELLLIGLTTLALCGIIALIRNRPELFDQIK